MDAGARRTRDGFGEIEAKVRSGERLSREDGLALYDCDDLAWLGGLAHEVRTRENGDVVHFSVNRQLTVGADEAAGPAQGQGLAQDLGGEHLTELRVLDAPRPGVPWDHYPRALRELRAALPETVALQAFTATAIHHFEKVSGRDAGDLLDELIDAGLESLTGGGAAIFDGEVRQHLVDHDTHWEDWSRIHRLAHEKGLKTPCTMLYGHIEEPRHRVDHVLRLRELQDETGGFEVFAPLRYQHADEGSAAFGGGEIRDVLPDHAPSATGAEALKTFAVSRLLFDNVPHVKVVWARHGVQTAQIALLHGADDMDGPVVEHADAHAADAGTPDALTRDDLLDLIRDAGFRPVERNARYETLREYEGLDPLRRESPQPMRL